MPRWLLLLLPLLAIPSPASAAEPTIDTYKDWTVGCDNGLICTAQTGQWGSDVRLSVTREPGPEGALTIELRAWPEARTRPLLRVDGRPLPLPRPAWSDLGDHDEVWVESADRGAVQAFLKAVRTGRSLQVSGSLTASLDGLNAALLRIDERQGRVGTVTALVRAGDRPASAVPKAPELPLVRPFVTRDRLARAEARQLMSHFRPLLQAQADQQGCDATNDVLHPEVHALDARRALFLLPCGMAAYNDSFLVFVVGRTDGTHSRLELPVPMVKPEDERQTFSDFPGASYDPGSASLSVVMKGQGLAVTGTTIAWTWTGQRFELAAMNQSLAEAGPSGDWPALFRSRTGP